MSKQIAIEQLLRTTENLKNSVETEKFVKVFEGVVNLVLKIEKRNIEAIEKLEKLHDDIVGKIRNDHSISLSDLKKQTNQLFVGDQIKRMDGESKASFNEFKETINRMIDNKMTQVDREVALKARQGRPGPQGEPGIGRPPTEGEISIALQPSVEAFRKAWEVKVQEVLARRGGVRGLGGASVILKFLNNITPTGAINGSNTAFVLPKAPKTNSEKVFLNGVRMRKGSSNDYTVSNKTITFNTAPLTNDIILVDIEY